MWWRYRSPPCAKGPVPPPSPEGRNGRAGPLGRRKPAPGAGSEPGQAPPSPLHAKGARSTVRRPGPSRSNRRRRSRHRRIPPSQTQDGRTASAARRSRRIPRNAVSPHRPLSADHFWQKMPICTVGSLIRDVIPSQKAPIAPFSDAKRRCACAHRHSGTRFPAERTQPCPFLAENVDVPVHTAHSGQKRLPPRRGGPLSWR
jgi:hypothetical protein